MKREKIDFVIEGNNDSDKTLVCVHGFGTNKDGGEGLFLDISKQLQSELRIIRFDFTGYGKSGGRQEDATLSKHKNDLDFILNYAKREFGEEIYIVAHSIGCFVVSLLSPDDIFKTIFSGIPNSDTSIIINFLKNRITAKGGNFNKGGISIYPRTSGDIQKVGANFWRDLEVFEPIESIGKYSKKTKLLIIHPMEDEIIGGRAIDEYKRIEDIEYLEISGTHNYSRKLDRENLIKHIKKFLL